VFEKQIIRNLGNPHGLFGMLVGRQLKENIREYSNALEFIKISAGMRLLDIGCGPGYGINEILNMNANIYIDGIDISELMCRSARKNIDNSRVRIISGDFISTTFEDEYYDKVLLLNIIYFWKDIKLNLNKVYRILKNQGEIVIGMSSPELLSSLLKKWKIYFNLHTLEEVENELRRLNIKYKIIEDNVNKGSYYILGMKV
jgi:ubiquinone/menaquinone biosynthesis C-methylase UbiE